MPNPEGLNQYTSGGGGASRPVYDRKAAMAAAKTARQAQSKRDKAAAKAAGYKRPSFGPTSAIDKMVSAHYSAVSKSAARRVK